MYVREQFLNHLMLHKDKDYIKVLTGVRRCGKSTLLEQYKDLLTSQGVNSNNIIFIKLDDLANMELLNYKSLYDFIKNHTNKNEQFYIFLDEIQLVDQFERTLASLQLYKNLDVYISGSNAYLLSNELATLLSGRYVEINIFPFSFAEYLDYHKGDIRERFNNYIKRGGFPNSLKIDNDTEYNDYITGVLNTILVKDVLNRVGIGNALLLESISMFLLRTSRKLSSQFPCT